MSQASHRDLEGGNDPAEGHLDHPQSTPNPPSQAESAFGNSSGPFFSIYCKAAKEEDNKMVDRWQKDADGTLIFTGLFSAAVAALLALTVQDLRPSSQDTSAFYLGNIYGVLADPNTTRAPIPSPVAQPPPFSPPRYAVWVNLLWFLSLVISVSCALLATSLNQWARRYTRLTQPARCTPEKRARMRASFSIGVEEMHIPWAVEGLPTLLHLALFLFFGGLVIFLFNVNHEVFIGVVWWIGLFSMVYGLMTLLPLIRQDSPYYGPLSTPAWFLFSTHTHKSWKRYRRMSKRYREWMLGDVEKKVEKNLQKTGSKKSSETDIHILDWTINTLGDDDSLENFFEAIPGLFKSKLVKHLERDFPVHLFISFWGALDGLMDRTLSYNSVTESVKSRRVIICRDIISRIPFPYYYYKEDDNLRSHFDQAPVSIERLRAMAQWRTHKNAYVANSARARVASNLARMQERDGDWIGLASDVCGLTVDALRDNIAHARENLLLATLVNVCRRTNRPDELDDLDEYVWKMGPVDALIKFDIHHALPELQHDFCALWNELVQEAKKRKSRTSLGILNGIRKLYIALHPGTELEAAPTSLASSIDSFLDELSTYPLCLIPSHRTDSIAHLRATNTSVVSSTHSSTHSSDTSSLDSTSSGSQSTVLRRVEIAVVVAETPSQPYPTAPGRIGDSSRGRPAANILALPAHTIPRPTDAPPLGAVVTALQDIPPTATLSHPLERTTQLDIVPPCAVPDITASMPKPTPVLALVQTPTPPTLDKSLASSDPGAALTPNPLLPTSSVVIPSIPSSPPPSRVPPSHNAEFLAFLSGTTSSRPTGNAALPRLHVCGLMNAGNMRFANAVLQLLMHSPPFWNLINELAELKRQRGPGGPEIGGGMTPLVDATVRFSEDYTFKEKELPSTQLPQRVAGGKLKDNGEEGKLDKIVDSFERTYMYDAMKDKRQLKDLLDGQQQDAEEFFRLYLDALDEELVTLLASVSGHKATAAPGVEEHEVSQSGQTVVGKPGFSKTESAEPPLVCIFGGKFRSTVRASNQPDNVTIENWRSLQLDIQHDSVHAIEDALPRISRLQPVQLGPSGPSAASQQVLIEALAPVLVIHLKRFLYDPAAGGVIKIGKPIQFTPELEIPLEFMAPAARTTSAELAHYKLYGVLYHYGESAGSGHYTVDVLHPNTDSDSGEAWLHIDDETVTAVRHEDVFGGHDDERRCAYMLFYSRTAPTQK